VLLPLLAHLITALVNGPDVMPNYHTTIFFVIVQLVAAVLFWACTALPGKIPGFTKMQGGKLSITFETILVFITFIADVEYEQYASMVCAGNQNIFTVLMIVTFVAPFLMIARHSCWAPTEFTAGPGFLLMLDGSPVATMGTCPALSFDDAIDQQSKKKLPRVAFEVAACKTI